MNLGGSGGGIVLFVLALLSALASLVECYSYYELIPKVQFFVNRQLYTTIQGEYVSYGPNTDLSKLLTVIDDPFFGCAAEANETDLQAFPTQSAFLLPDSSHCTISEKSSYLYSTYQARAVILYRLSDEDEEQENRERRQNVQRTSSQTSNGPTIIRLNLLMEQLTRLLTGQKDGNRIQVIVEAQLMQRGFRTSQTFYFVVFAFCILMLLSCSWLLLSYFRRCHYRWRLRRNQARSANETRQMVNRLPTKSYKSSKEKGEVPTCVVCLEVFKNHESIRILPCKHEFHKKCIDPWLKMKRTCPMCKQDIFPSKRRRKSSSDATTGSSNSRRNQRDSTARASSQDPMAVLVTTAATSRTSLRRSRSWSDSSTVSGNSSSSGAASNTSATPLLSGASESRSYDDSEIQVIVVRPASVQEVLVEEGEGERGNSSVAVVVDESFQQQQQQEEDQSPREGQSDHIGVDIEGAGLVHPAPVVNA